MRLKTRLFCSTITYYCGTVSPKNSESFVVNLPKSNMKVPSKSMAIVKKQMRLLLLVFLQNSRRLESSVMIFKYLLKDKVEDGL